MTNFYNNSGQLAGQSSPVVIPRDGTYYVRVESWHDYTGEYRFRVSLAPPGSPRWKARTTTISHRPIRESHLGRQLAQRHGGGFLADYDSSGDYYNLGNLAAGTQVTAMLRLPSTSTLRRP